MTIMMIISESDKSRFAMTKCRVYPKSSDTLTPKHIDPKIWTSPFDYLIKCLNVTAK